MKFSPGAMKYMKWNKIDVDFEKHPDYRRVFLDRLYSCEGKTCYGTALPATKAAYNLEQIRPGESFVPYNCRYCEYYHIGHQKDRSRYNYNFDKELIEYVRIRREEK